jgi:nucleoside phosphorylase
VNAPGEQKLVVVVGMKREARIIGRRARVSIRGVGISQALLREATGILSFGICGGLDPALRVGDIVVGTGVVTDAVVRFAADPPWTDRLAAALPGAVRAEFAGGDIMVASPGAKAALRMRSRAGCADMESHVVAELAAQAGLPFAIVRAVSDTADHTLPPAALAGFGPDGGADVSAVIAALLRRPFELFPLIRTALHAGRAIRALEQAAGSILDVRP